MIYREEQMNLLDVPQGYMLAHCISADYALGAGIAKTIDEAYGMRKMLAASWPDGREMYDAMGAMCLPCANVYNLVTKARCWHKPTLDSLREALHDMRLHVVEEGVTKIAMPKIGCGLDRLEWEDVKPMIQEVFDDTDVEILICYL